MLIFDKDNEAVILESIYAPTLADHFWVLDLNMLDFTLSPLLVLEEIVGPSIQILINGFQFILPANWNILVCDPESMQLDVIEVAEVAGKEFSAMLYGPNHSMVQTATIAATDYFPSYANIGPSLNKHQMLCHPVAPETWICISPSDTYNKYLKDLVSGDLI